MTQLLDRLDDRVAAAVRIISADPDRQEQVGWRLVKVGSALAGGSALTLAALGFGVRIGYYLFGDLL